MKDGLMLEWDILILGTGFLVLRISRTILPVIICETAMSAGECSQRWLR